MAMFKFYSWATQCNAIPVNRFNGKPVYLFYVARRLLDATPETLIPTTLSTVEVIAHNSAEAANHVLLDTIIEYEQPCEVVAKGPKGGVAHRYAQWPTVIGELMFHRNRKPKQPTLALVVDKQ